MLHAADIALREAAPLDGERLRARAVSTAITLARGGRPRELPRRPRVPRPRDRSPLSAERVLSWYRRTLGCGSTWDVEVSAAIAEAALADPLWPPPDGPTQTAAVLFALATSSGMQPTRVGNGDGSTGYGLYAILMPPGARHLSADVLLLPRTASYVAIDLLRQQFDAWEGPGSAPSLEDAFRWYPEADPPTLRDECMHASRVQVALQVMLLPPLASSHTIPEEWGPAPTDDDDAEGD